ncbi:hypothetical protein TcasGA2_TC008528 [Tribolium castaneum]|uniref:Reverse transcriptase domain-containing protein n=1 Tax=Tribolium castaneum TaxID=7070 RepID=D7EI95_TRICA|nr:hypothetical protein TcasGA2_TC008528 [Tribolium castaneum]
MYLYLTFRTILSTVLVSKLHVSIPIVPKLYCLPKIHKPGKSVRPIVSAIDATTSKVSKWLTDEFNNLPLQRPSCSVKNSLEFINKVKDITLHEDELLVSFDVSSLFPSVPIPQTLTYLKDLEQQVINEYIQFTELCMKQNIFQFSGKFFEQQEGTAMGNSLSPFLADLLMSRFEKNLENELEYFPRVWLRYVDDIFAIFDLSKCTIEEFIKILNNRFKSIKFTCEKEVDGMLPFLDTLVIKANYILEFDIYKKDTSILRYITADSHHCPQHKMASFNFLIHRLINFPLNNARFEKELKIIKDAARCNGFGTRTVDKIVRKVKYRYMIKQSTTFTNTPEKKNFITFPYTPSVTRDLSRIFKNLDLQVVYNSGTSLKSFLGSPKDKIGFLEKLWIYEINCKDCELKYIGQTRRSVNIRFKEHLAHLKFNRFEKSSVAQHIF